MLERKLRYVIRSILLESSETDEDVMGSDLTPPVVPYVPKEVPQQEVSNLKLLQKVLGVAQTGIYDYVTEKAWDTLVMDLSSLDVEGSTPVDIATDWNLAAPKIKRVRGKVVSYPPNLRGMAEFVSQIKEIPLPDLTVSYYDSYQTYPTYSSEPEAVIPTRTIQYNFPEGAYQDPKTGVFRYWPPEVLGKYKGRKINFNKLIRGNNNYRGAMRVDWDKGYTVHSVDLFKRLKEDFGIERVITLNSDRGGDGLPALVRAAGLESIYVPIGSNPDPDEWAKIKSALNKGNTLVHCAHGADRTGGVVGRWYVEDHGMSIEDAIRDLVKYKPNPYRCYVSYVITGMKKEPGKGCSDDQMNLGEALEFAKTHPHRNTNPH